MKVSVIIATHGRPQALAQCLEMLDRQSFPADDFEIIVVDDFSDEPLALARNAGQLPRLSVYRTTVKSGPGNARNLGANHAAGELLAFTDDDCLPDPHWLTELWTAHQAHPAVMLGGTLYNAVPEYIGAEASQVISETVYAWYNANPVRSRFFSTNNAAVPMAGFRALRGFDTAFYGASEDRDFCDRWLASGRTMHFVPGAVIGHAHRLTLRKYVRQHFGYGRGAAIYHERRRKRGTGSLRTELPFHGRFSFLAWKRLRREPPGKMFVLILLCIVWQLANAAGYLYERFIVRKRVRMVQELNVN